MNFACKTSIFKTKSTVIWIPIITCGHFWCKWFWILFSTGILTVFYAWWLYIQCSTNHMSFNYIIELWIYIWVRQLVAQGTVVHSHPFLWYSSANNLHEAGHFFYNCNSYVFFSWLKKLLSRYWLLKLLFLIISLVCLVMMVLWFWIHVDTM